MIIYKAENIQNGNIYIGKTVYQLNKRIKEHIFDTKRYFNYFHKAIKKYGKENFSWSILDSTAKSEEELNEQEKFFIMLYKANGYKLYNLTLGGEGVSGLKHSEESKKIRSEKAKNRSPEYRKKLSDCQKGKKFSKERILKMSISRLGKKNTKRKVYEKDCLNIIMLYDTGLVTQNQLSLFYNISKQTVRKIINYRYKWYNYKIA